MKNIFLIVSFLITSNIVLAEDNNKIVAMVNGIEIRYQNFLQEYRQQKMVIGDKSVTKKTVLNHLINRALGIQTAKKAGLDQNPIVKQKMNEVLFHAQVSKDIEPLLLNLRVSDKELRKYYNEHKEYRTAHILFRMRANPVKEEQQAAFNQALKISKKIKNRPESFAEMANKYSQTSLAPNGGDMGFQPSSALAPEYFRAINGKKTGYIVGPIRTQFGYHIIKVLGVKDFKEIAKIKYQKFAYDQKRDKIIESYFKQERKKGQIKIYQKNL